jgi:hypothetical protein
MQIHNSSSSTSIMIMIRSTNIMILIGITVGYNCHVALGSTNGVAFTDGKRWQMLVVCKGIETLHMHIHACIYTSYIHACIHTCIHTSKQMQVSYIHTDKKHAYNHADILTRLFLISMFASAVMSCVIVA